MPQVAAVIDEMSKSWEAFSAALQHHQAGRLREADEIYGQLTANEPSFPDAWHLRGVIASQTGRHEIAIQLIQRALELDPNNAQVHNNLGVALNFQQKWTEAAACFCRAAELAPDDAEIHENLGAVFKRQAKLTEAISSYRRALELEPERAVARHNLALIFHDMALAFQDKGNLQKAIENYRQALAIKPDLAAIHFNLGNALSKDGKLVESVACYRRALQLEPDFFEAHTNLGEALRALGHLTEAVACHRQATLLKPDNASARSNLGLAIYHAENDPAQAITHFRQALELQPNLAEAHLNLAVALREQGEYDAAAKSYNRALESNPDFSDAHVGLATLSLLSGDFGRGWSKYEWRWSRGQLPPRGFSRPQWDGNSLLGKSIVLHAEQGLGDTLQFIRFAPLVKANGGTVIVECQKGLVPLLRSAAGVDQLFGEGDPLPPFDVFAPLLSLPEILRTTVDTIPSGAPYLFADQSLIAHWREKLKPYRGYKIGINWRGRAGFLDSHKRDAPLSAFASLAAVPGVYLISLQQGPGREELVKSGSRSSIADLGDEIDRKHGAFMDTAAIMMNLDLVITTDTSIPHLAGALGVPVWLALPSAPDWRWLLDRGDSPWYPTMRLFRQRTRGNWTAVFEEMEQLLRQGM